MTRNLKVTVKGKVIGNATQVTVTLTKENSQTFSPCLLKCPECGFTSQLNIRNDILPEYLKRGIFRLCGKCLKGRLQKVKIIIEKEKVNFT